MNTIRSRCLVSRPTAVRASGRKRVSTSFLLKTRDDLRRTLSREPTNEEITEVTGYKGGRGGKFLILNPITILSLCTPVTLAKDKKILFEETLRDTRAPSPLTLVEARDELDEKLRSLCKLRESLATVESSVRNRDMFERFYGLSGSKALTHKEIGAHYGVSKQRVEQIIDRIWQKFGAHRLPLKKEDVVRTLDEIEMLKEALTL